MDWFISTITSSVGKKLVMAFTGLCFVAFVSVHLFGNLTVLAGKESFQGYIEHLHSSYKYLIPVAEVVLFIFGIFHVLFGTTLYFQNLRARPIGYSIKKNAGGRTLGSITTPYTGLFLLVFIILHLIRFRFVDKTSLDDYTILVNTFNQPSYVVFYVLAMIALGLHLSHGIWSAFQTLGINHPKYNSLIEKGGTLLSLIISIGFALIPITLYIKLQ